MEVLNQMCNKVHELSVDNEIWTECMRVKMLIYVYCFEQKKLSIDNISSLVTLILNRLIVEVDLKWCTYRFLNVKRRTKTHFKRYRFAVVRYGTLRMTTIEIFVWTKRSMSEKWERLIDRFTGNNRSFHP